MISSTKDVVDIVPTKRRGKAKEELFEDDDPHLYHYLVEASENEPLPKWALVNSLMIAILDGLFLNFSG